MPEYRVVDHRGTEWGWALSLNGEVTRPLSLVWPHDAIRDDWGHETWATLVHVTACLSPVGHQATT